MNNHLSTKFMKNYRNIIFSIIIFSLILFPMIEDIVALKTISPDTFYGKEQLHTWINNFKYYVMRDKVFNGLYAANDNWLVYTGESSVSDFQNSDRFTKNELMDVHKRLDYLCSELTKIGTKFIVMIPPNKNTIYPEYLPPEMAPIQAGSRLDQVMSIWQDTKNCRVIDLRAELLNAKKDNLVYYKTDTHWNSLGAYIGYQKLSSIIKEDFPTIHIRDLSEYSMIIKDHKGDLNGNKFGHFDLPDSALFLDPKFQKTVLSKGYVSLEGLKIGTNNTYWSYTNNNDFPDVIIVQDSFFNTLKPFIDEDFHEALYLWSLGIDMDLIRMRKPDYLIIEITERFLYPSLFRLPLPE
jgi:hypothetical protein